MDAPIEQLRALYGEWARGDFSRDVFDEETVGRMIGWVDLDAELRGSDRILAGMRDWLSAWEEPLVIEVDEFIESGDRILALVRWDVYRDRDEARAALGRAAGGGDT